MWVAVTQEWCSDLMTNATFDFLLDSSPFLLSFLMPHQDVLPGACANTLAAPHLLLVLLTPTLRSPCRPPALSQLWNTTQSPIRCVHVETHCQGLHQATHTHDTHTHTLTPPLHSQGSPRHPLRGYPVLVTVEVRAAAGDTLVASSSRMAWAPKPKPPKQVQGNWMPGSLAPVALNVALHAQSKYSQHGFVSGSEVTTNGIAAALRQVPDVAHVHVFAPFAYGELLRRRWDLVLVEGWYGMVPSFIHVLRRRNPKVVVLYMCLDTYPTPHAFAQLDVDGFLTNSRHMQRLLARVAPTRHMQLAVDPAVMHRTQGNDSYRHAAVFLGHDSLKKDNLHGMLLEAAPYGLAVYGGNWNKSTAPELGSHYHGILPLNDIADLYSSADVVVGTTDVLQKALGMVNNRVFEALACGAVLISDHFPALERLFGDAVLYARQPGDVAAHLRRLLTEPGGREELAARSARGQQLVASAHTWMHRLRQVFGLYDEIMASRNAVAELRRHEAPIVDVEQQQPRPSLPAPAPLGRLHRPNRPIVAVVLDAADARRLAAVHGIDPHLTSGEALAAHVVDVFGHPELQTHYRMVVVAVVPEVCAHAVVPECRQVVLPATGGAVHPAVTVTATTAHVLDDGHPLHDMAFRLAVVVAAGRPGGVAASQVDAWFAPRPDWKRSVVNFMPRRVLLPWVCTPDLATAPQYDAVVCLPASPGVGAAAGSALAGGQPAGTPHLTRVVSLGGTSRIGRRPVSHRAQELSAVLSAVLLYRRATSWAHMASPVDGQWVALEDGAMHVRAVVNNFDVPGQGSWALIVNGTEIMRVGDGLFSLNYSLPATMPEMRDILAAQLGAPYLPLASTYTLRVQLRLRDGLIGEEEQWRGPPVHVHVYSVRDGTPAAAVGAPVPQLQQQLTDTPGGGVVDGTVPLTEAVQRLGRGAPTMLSLGCFRGPAPPPPPPPTAPSAGGPDVLRLYDPRCGGLNDADPPTELPLQWVQRSLAATTHLMEHGVTLPDNAAAPGPRIALDAGLATGPDFVGAAPPAVAGMAALPHPAATRHDVDAVVVNASFASATRCVQLPSVPCDDFHAAGASSLSAPAPAPAAGSVVQWNAHDVDSDASVLLRLPAGAFHACSLHWVLHTQPRGNVQQFLRLVHRAMAPGAVLRITEPDFHVFQSPSRRAGTTFGVDPEPMSPFTARTVLQRLGFVNITSLSLDQSTATPLPLAQALVFDGVDNVDVALAESDVARVFVMEAAKGW